MDLRCTRPGDAYAGHGPVIVNASCTFLVPLVYPGDIEVRDVPGRARAARASAASTRFIADGAKHADGAAKIVWIDLASGTPEPLAGRDRDAAAARRLRASVPMTTTNALDSRRPSASRRRTSPRSRKRVAARARRRLSPTTRRCGAGRSTTAKRSGARCGISPASSATRGERALVDADKMPGARLFPDARLNFAENLLRAGRRRRGDALVFWGEDKVERRAVARRAASRWSRALAQALQARGRRRRATASPRYLPNMPETIIAMLGDREPRRDLVVVLAGFRRAGRARPLRPDRAARCSSPSTATGTTARRIDIARQASREIVARSCRRVEQVVVVPYLGVAADVARPCRNAVTLRRIPRAVSRRRRSTSRGCRSTIRSTSCIPRARPACRSASCTARAARCCST